MREKTHAHRFFKDNVSEDIKQERLVLLNDKIKEHQVLKYKSEIGRFFD